MIGVWPGNSGSIRSEGWETISIINLIFFITKTVFASQQLINLLVITLYSRFLTFFFYSILLLCETTISMVQTHTICKRANFVWLGFQTFIFLITNLWESFFLLLLCFTISFLYIFSQNFFFYLFLCFSPNLLMFFPCLYICLQSLNLKTFP